MSDLNFSNLKTYLSSAHFIVFIQCSYVLITSGTGDFQLLPDQIIIPSTEALNTLVCQNITILGDTVEEENETFTFRAFVTIPDTITQPDTFTVTIVDDGDSMFNKTIDTTVYIWWQGLPVFWGKIFSYLTTGCSWCDQLTMIAAVGITNKMTKEHQSLLKDGPGWAWFIQFYLYPHSKLRTDHANTIWNKCHVLLVLLLSTVWQVLGLQALQTILISLLHGTACGLINCVL